MPSTLELLGGVAAATIGAYAVYKATRPKIGECCPGQSAGFLPQDPNYVAKGEVKDIGGGRLAYVVGTGAEAVVLFHDIFGLYTGRHKQVVVAAAAAAVAAYMHTCIHALRMIIYT